MSSYTQIEVLLVSSKEVALQVIARKGKKKKLDAKTC
jgi:hypothetical protein